MNSSGQAAEPAVTEILFGETLLRVRRTRRVPRSLRRPSSMLNAAEKRLLTEWIDLGGQYYNDPFNPNGSVRAIDGLSESVFAAQVHPILRATCGASCHMAIGSDRATSDGTPFRDNRFVLTGSEEGDFGATLSMISDTCNAASNALLSRPSSIPHPAGAVGQAAAVLPAGSVNYNTIATWIATGCR